MLIETTIFRMNRSLQPEPKPLSTDEAVSLVFAAALLTAPLCRVLRRLGERLRAKWQDESDDELEVAAECEVANEDDRDDTEDREPTRCDSSGEEDGTANV